MHVCSRISISKLKNLYFKLIKMKIFSIIYCLLNILIIISAYKNIIDAEKELIKKIFKDYDKKLRPSDKVEIKFSLYLNQIISLIEQEQILVINAFLDHEWTDPRLSWNQTEFNNITLLRINSDLVWT